MATTTRRKSGIKPEEGHDLGGKKDEKPPEIIVPEVRTESIVVSVVGTSPLICAKMSEKARQQLLLPAGRKNAAQKQSEAKHNVIEEFEASPYILPEGSATLLALMSTSFKAAMGTAALDLPGTKKAQIGRLVYVKGDYTPVYGLPKLFMSVVRSADINKTPDIRTRVILPRWAAEITIDFVKPLLNAQSVVNLLAAAGVTAGVGDWRPEKGKGSYGQYRVVSPDDKELIEIMKEGGRDAQIAGMEDHIPYDHDTQSLLSWYTDEFSRRGFATK